MKNHLIKSPVFKLLTVLLAFSLTGCFEIIEEVQLNSNGSGSLTYTFNFSQSKTKINSALLLDSFNGFKIPDEQSVKRKIDEAINKLKEAEGISNVKAVQNFNDYIFTFSCDFNEVESLNKATKFLKESYSINDKSFSNSSHFTFNKSSKTFTRKGDYGKKANPNEVDDEMLSALNKAEFTSIYRFNQEIESVSNTTAKISPNKKAVMLKHKAMDIATGKQTIENIIILK